MSEPKKPTDARVSLLIERNGKVERYTHDDDNGNVMAGLITVTTAAFAVHRRALMQQWETLRGRLAEMGYDFAKIPPVTAENAPKPHRIAECRDPFCPWHSITDPGTPDPLSPIRTRDAEHDEAGCSDPFCTQHRHAS